MTPDDVCAAFVLCRGCGCWARAVGHQCPGPVRPGDSEVGPEFEHCMDGRPECEEFQRLMAEVKRATADGRQVQHLRVLRGGKR